MNQQSWGLSQTISNNSTVAGSVASLGGGDNSGSGRNIFVARVTDIILDSSHPKFDENGKWDSIGTVYYKSISNSAIEGISTAKPLFPNIKHYPLVNEIIYYTTLPNPESQFINDPNKVNKDTQTYYFPPINIWNSIHHNALPLDNLQNNVNVQNDYTASEAGLIREVKDGETGILLNSPYTTPTFEERINIQSLLPYAGDNIIEGRWGNSIRFGSTVSGSFVNSGWSNFGENGNPITIIRNGAALNDLPGWECTIEDFNFDTSSIWLTNNQQLNISASSSDYYSYPQGNKPTNPNEFTGNQVAINSGRLFFNSKTDHILFSSKKSINFNAKTSVNIDAVENTTIQSPKIYLGSFYDETISHPLIYGDKLSELLSEILGDLQALSIALQTQVTPHPGSLLVPTSGVAFEINKKIPNYLIRLSESLSTTSYTL